MIRLKRSGLSEDPRDTLRLRSSFDVSHCIKLPRLLEPDLLSFLGERLKQGLWKEYVHPGIGVEHVLDDTPAIHLLHFLANLPKFRKLMEDITGCTPLTRFGGRVYRMLPNAGHYDSWHNDVNDNRAVGMSLNLSLHGYRGGLFQLRKKGCEGILTEVANTGFGDAIIFRISSQLEHRVSAVQDGEPKMAFAGWFRPDSEDFFASLKRAAAVSSPGQHV